MTQSPESGNTTEHTETTPAQEDVKQSGTRFAELGLDKRLLDAIAGIGFEYCTPIQAETLPYTLACHDLGVLDYSYPDPTGNACS